MPILAVIVGLLVLVMFLHYFPSRKNEGEKYVPGTGKTLTYRLGWGTAPAMYIVERGRLMNYSDYVNVVFARILGVTKTKDFVNDGG